MPRHLGPLIEEYFGELPALMIVGPRACGKTTTTGRFVRTTVRLDTEEAGIFHINPDAALRDKTEPVLLDEWQAVPSVLGAVKRAVDTEWRPGRFILTGSARALGGGDMWPGTGRVVILRMYPMTIAEQKQRPLNPLIDRLAAGETPQRALGPPLDVTDYLRLALAGGFPEPALSLGARAAAAWYQSYADQVALRDASAYGESRDSTRLRRYLQACALVSGHVAQHKTIYDAAGISRNAATSYDALLNDLMVTGDLPPWSSNQLRRLARTPKRYIIDSGLLAGILQIGVDEAASSPALLGSLIETFVVAQLRAEAIVARSGFRLSHLRTLDGRHEVDVVAEFGGTQLVGIEIKAAARIGRSDARHLEWLRDELGEHFSAGVVLHTGPDTYELADRITAAPISTLWA